MSVRNMSKLNRLKRILLPILLIGIGSGLVSCSIWPQPTDPPSSTETPSIKSCDITGPITITVKDEQNQDVTEGVVVHVTGTECSDDFDRGEFRVDPCNPGQAIAVYAPGYQTSFTNCDGQLTHYNIVIKRLVAADNPNHTWIPAGVGSNSPQNCVNCHSGRNDPAHNEFDEWRISGHAKVFSNRFFETVYLGTDLNRNKSPDTQWDIIDNHLVQRAPTVDANYRGPGFKLDFPARYGNCAYCHAPALVSPAMTDVNPGQYFPYPGGAIGEGVTCDVCHKVIGIQLDENGYPYVDRPGILSFQFLRPGDDPRLQIGPSTSLTNINNSNHSSTCSSNFSDSEFCAACHFGKFSDTLIYGSYWEWRNSPYASDPNSKSFRSCQDCHMSHDPSRLGESIPAQRDACSAQNTSHFDFNHNMLNYGYDEDAKSEIPRMIKGAAIVNAEFSYDPAKKNWFTVTAKVKSKDVGHKFPTDSPLRHLILVVEVTDERGTILSQVDGNSIPNWGGSGDPAHENPNIRLYAGQPGRIFAHLLAEEDTNISPTTAYWNETKLAWVGDLNENPLDHSDTRLVPEQVYPSKYSFEVPDRGDIKVTIKLIYRFAFYDLMRQKGWNRPDVLVTQKNWVCKRQENSAEFKCE